jgi:nonribosomal peptide synthetase DhbF
MIDHSSPWGRTQTQAAILALQPFKRPATIPLSFPQLWVHNSLGDVERDRKYHVSVTVRIPQKIEVPAFETVLMDLVKRHEILRTVFPVSNGERRQEILDADRVQLRVTLASTTKAFLARDLDLATKAPFDVGVDIPFRPYIFVLESDENIVHLVFHHFAIDVWSAREVLSELFRNYLLRAQGVSPRWPKLPVQYADYVFWQRQRLGHEEVPLSLSAQQIAFWKTVLKDVPVPSNFVNERSGMEDPREDIQSVPFRFHQDLYSRLSSTARGIRANVFAMLHAAIALLLEELGAGNDIVIATSVSGRGDEALRSLIGLFENIVLLRTNLSDVPTFKDLVTRVLGTHLKAFANQDVPFGRLLEVLRPGTVCLPGSLAKVMIVINEVPEMRQISSYTTTIRPGSSYRMAFDLVFSVTMHKAGKQSLTNLDGIIEYNGARFERRSVERIRDRLIELLERACTSPGISVEDLVKHSDPSGKVQFRRSGHASVQFVVPQFPSQDQLAGIWEQMLGVGSVGAWDDFFELGGSVELAQEMVKEVEQLWRVRLPLSPG